MTAALEAPAENSRSLAFVVASGPLSIAPPVPMAVFAPSTGLSLSTPEYSWMYMTAKELIELPNVAVTVFAPPAMFLA